MQIKSHVLIYDGPECWAKNSTKLQWIIFDRTDGLRVQGNGLIDGRGENWWNLPCKPHRVIHLSSLQYLYLQILLLLEKLWNMNETFRTEAPLLFKEFKL